MYENIKNYIYSAILNKNAGAEEEAKSHGGLQVITRMTEGAPRPSPNPYQSPCRGRGVRQRQCLTMFLWSLN